jgi:hypothetical protein
MTPTIDIISNYTVVYLGSIWSICFIFMLVSLLRHCLSRGSHTIEQKSQYSESSSSLKAVKINILKYVDMIFPLALLSEKLLWKNMFADWLSNHSYLRLFKPPNNLLTNSRIRIILEATSTQTLLCFAVHYGINYMVPSTFIWRLLVDFLCRLPMMCVGHCQEIIYVTDPLYARGTLPWMRRVI